MAKKKIRPIKVTVVIVAEGIADAAFATHIKSIYGKGNPKITIKSAGGKGPGNVISDAIGTLKYSGCDKVVAFLDTDIEWPKTLIKEAQKHSIPLIGSSPCLEGLLLKILGQRVPEQSHECKKMLHPQLSGKETDKLSYEALFHKNTLENARTTVSELDLLIKIISGEI